MSDSFPNPLLPIHRESAIVEFQNYDAIEIVSTFGEPQAEYAALHRLAGMMDCPQRGVIELTGKDRLTFLNNLLSNETFDKEKKLPLEAGRTTYAFLLNGKGRIAADVTVIELGERTLIECDVRFVSDLCELFQQYLFVEQVKIRSLVGEVSEVALLGPRTVSQLGASAKIGEKNTCRSILLDGVSAVAWSDDPIGTPGVNLLVPTAEITKVWNSLLARSFRPTGWAAFNAARIEAGRPLVGIDVGTVPIATALPSKKQREAAEVDDAAPGVLPAESGLFERAVSLRKCYLGQEIVARMHARKQVARKIVGVRIDDEALPLAGATLSDSAGNAVGAITSSTVSPILSNASIALAFVKKAAYEIGTVLSVPAEGAMRRAVVVELPFVKRAVPSPGTLGEG